MLNIYQEFVRNHQYSLQILAHCKQNRDFDKLLKQYEAKPDCEERTLETFLTYPMFQVIFHLRCFAQSQGPVLLKRRTVNMFCFGWLAVGSTARVINLECLACENAALIVSCVHMTKCGYECVLQQNAKKAKKYPLV